MKKRQGMMWLTLTTFVLILFLGMAANQAWAAPLLGITPTPTPGGPSSPAEVPEPMTLALLGAGVAGLIGYVRNRQK